jgi:hypothetical protein
MALRYQCFQACHYIHLNHYIHRGISQTQFMSRIILSTLIPFWFICHVADWMWRYQTRKHSDWSWNCQSSRLCMSFALFDRSCYVIIILFEVLFYEFVVCDRSLRVLLESACVVRPTLNMYRRDGIVLQNYCFTISIILKLSICGTFQKGKRHRAFSFERVIELTYPIHNMHKT